MADARRLTWTLDFKDGASRGIQDVDNKLTGVGKSMKSLGSGMQKTGKSLSKWVSAPLAGVGAASLKTVADFDDGMSRVGSISGATGEEFDALREKAIELGRDTAYSASEAAEGMQILAASGMEAGDILETSGDMFTLMSAGATDSNTAASILTNTMSQFKMEASEAGRITDVFAQGSADAKVGVEDLEYAMGMAGATMASMNMDIEQSTAMVGQLANAGVPVQQVGTMINAMSRDIQANAGEFQQLGIEVYDASGQMRDMGAIMGDLESQLGGMSDVQRDQALSALFSGQAQRGANAWLQEGSGAYNELTQSMYDAAGAGEDMAAKNEDNIGGAMRSLGSSIETLMIKIGDVIKGPVGDAAEFIGDLAEKFSELDESTQETIVKFGAIAFAIGPLMSIGGKLIGGIVGIPGKLGSAFGMLKGLFSPTTLAIGLLVIAGVALYKNWDKIKEAAGQLKAKVVEAWEAIKEGISEKVQAIKDKWEDMKSAVSETITGKIDAVKEGFQQGVAGVQEKWQEIKSAVGERAQGVIDAVKSKFDSVTSAAKGAWETTKGVLSSVARGTVDAVKTQFDSAVSSAKSAWGTLKGQLAKVAKGTVEAVTGKFHSAVEKAKKAWDTLRGIISKPIKGAVNVVSKGVDKVKGWAGSHRTGADNIPYNNYPAKLHKGEMVLTKSAATAFRRMGGSKNTVPQPIVTNEVSQVQKRGRSESVVLSPHVEVNVHGDADRATANNIADEVQRAVNQELEKAFIKLQLQGV